MYLGFKESSLIEVRTVFGGLNVTACIRSVDESTEKLLTETSTNHICLVRRIVDSFKNLLSVSNSWSCWVARTVF